MAEEAPPVPRKVRSACRRCRQKRIKCDGGIPACGNCGRAKVPCVDVHGGNNHLSIPRDFAIKCGARIQWLEHALRSLQPDFDMSQGPQVNMGFIETLSSSQESLPSEAFTREEELVNKRSHSAMEESDVGSPLSIKARSVAIDLGMLSLQSDSRQQHYLGSSSGLLFTKLVGLDSEIQSPKDAVTLHGIVKSRRSPPRIPTEKLKSIYKTLARVSKHISFKAHSSARIRLKYLAGDSFAGRSQRLVWHIFSKHPHRSTISASSLLTQCLPSVIHMCPRRA